MVIHIQDEVLSHDSQSNDSNVSTKNQISIQIRISNPIPDFKCISGFQMHFRISNPLLDIKSIARFQIPGEGAGFSEEGLKIRNITGEKQIHSPPPPPFDQMYLFFPRGIGSKVRFFLSNPKNIREQSGSSSFTYAKYFMGSLSIRIYSIKVDENPIFLTLVRIFHDGL
jgi:hypothetical protein